MTIDLPLYATGNAGIIKDGDGFLSFTGAEANTFPGETYVRRGGLSLSRTAITVPRELRIGGGADTASVFVRTGNIADLSNVAVGANGQFAMSNAQDVIGSLTLTSGGTLSLDAGGPAPSPR